MASVLRLLLWKLNGLVRDSVLNWTLAVLIPLTFHCKLNDIIRCSWSSSLKVSPQSWKIESARNRNLDVILWGCSYAAAGFDYYAFYTIIFPTGLLNAEIPSLLAYNFCCYQRELGTRNEVST